MKLRKLLLEMSNPSTVKKGSIITVSSISGKEFKVKVTEDSYEDEDGEWVVHYQYDTEGPITEPKSKYSDETHWYAYYEDGEWIAGEN